MSGTQMRQLKLGNENWMDRKTGQINGKTAGLLRVTQGPCRLQQRHK